MAFSEAKQLAKLIDELREIDWGSYLRAKIGGPPEKILSPHAHHILFKLGRGAKSRKLIAEAFEIFEKHGIDPILGLENLVWAPNIKGQHTYEALEKIVNAIKAADRKGGAEAVKRVLKQLGQEAADLGTK